MGHYTLSMTQINNANGETLVLYGDAKSVWSAWYAHKQLRGEDQEWKDKVVDYMGYECDLNSGSKLNYIKRK